MSEDSKLLPAAILANKLAWDSLLVALAAKGSVDLHAVGNDMRNIQQALRDSNESEIADALSLHLETIESLTGGKG